MADDLPGQILALSSPCVADCWPSSHHHHHQSVMQASSSNLDILSIWVDKSPNA
ncbi:hypothetical protein K443DRAFT_3662 [Laccaria amethystina LaAM-08-1]|uniref:Uncharacterized protein n=1 Tax=Laccaria amethystina LaAM-08-1 TaxID=1095629 RepID=A0A0C9YBZ5_9AGAR|nr:hypothetical protein K443DRAFT_3662 [Laccaria amethystina LaAM-08-1]